MRLASWEAKEAVAKWIVLTIHRFTGTAGVSPALSAKREKVIQKRMLSFARDAGETPAVPVSS
jgi:hypothetical protein